MQLIDDNLLIIIDYNLFANFGGDHSFFFVRFLLVYRLFSFSLLYLFLSLSLNLRNRILSRFRCPGIPFISLSLVFVVYRYFVLFSHSLYLILSFIFINFIRSYPLIYSLLFKSLPSLSSLFFVIYRYFALYLIYSHFILPYISSISFILIFSFFL